MSFYNDISELEGCLCSIGAKQIGPNAFNPPPGGNGGPTNVIVNTNPILPRENGFTVVQAGPKQARPNTGTGTITAPGDGTADVQDFVPPPDVPVIIENPAQSAVKIPAWLIAAGIGLLILK